ncbi:MAG: DAK2 domain-containing protein, partial [Eubacteriales bacterium]|nr:DAK2 domain-containing protein [Eubacteriales bacterium]
MENLQINGALLRDMFNMGAALLEKNKNVIDALNVFPVPDGDTGTNMSMTMQSAVREVKACEGERVCDVADAAALGALKGARGNSGVILSQIFRGFAKALANQDEMDAGMLAMALSTGTEAAYKAVMKPKEGTMLTVARMMAERATELWEDGANVYKLLDLMITRGEEALKMTPDLLPVLKEAGVVDSGGKGLLTIFKGFKMALDGEELDDYVDVAAQEAPSLSQDADLSLEDVENIKFGYCTEFFVEHLDS